VLLTLGTLAAACGNGSPSAGDGAREHGAAGTPTTAGSAAGLCAGDAPVAVGALADPALGEVSGLAASRSHDVLWAHNDSGDEPRLFALASDGTTRAVVTVTGAQAHDWEDVALDGTTLYVGDIGDNRRERAGIVVYRVAEPAPDGTVAATEPAAAIALRYPDGPHDAEALMADPRTGDVVVVTKDLAGVARVYRAAPEEGGALEHVATLELGVGEMVTAGDVSDTGDVVALRTYGSVFVWERRGDEPLAGAFARPPCRAPAATEARGEALALMSGGQRFVTVSEGGGATLWTTAAVTAGR
jgi:hypothetical protein